MEEYMKNWIKIESDLIGAAMKTKVSFFLSPVVVQQAAVSEYILNLENIVVSGKSSPYS